MPRRTEEKEEDVVAQRARQEAYVLSHAFDRWKDDHEAMGHIQAVFDLIRRTRESDPDETRGGRVFDDEIYNKELDGILSDPAASEVLLHTRLSMGLTSMQIIRRMVELDENSPLMSEN